MNSAELISFIPLLLYGIALADLFSQWRRFFDKNLIYWPYVISTIVFTEIAIWNIYLFIGQLQSLNFESYYDYWIILVQPIIFVLAIHAFTPDPENKDTEAYFRKRLTVVFSLFAIYIGLHMIPGASVGKEIIFTRVFAIFLCLSIALTRFTPLVYILGVLWLVSLFFR